MPISTTRLAKKRATASRKKARETGELPRSKMKRHQVTRKTKNGSTTYWRGKGGKGERYSDKEKEELKIQRATKQLSKEEIHRKRAKYRLKKMPKNADL